MKRFHTLTSKGEWDQAMALVDIDAKCRRMMGELYADAPASDQAETRDIWQRRLKFTTEQYLDKHFGESLGELRQLEGQDSPVQVSQKKGAFMLIYTLEKRDDGWLIVDRIHEFDGNRPDPSRSLGVILSRIEKELGHKPTLAEVNARLEDYMKRLKVRRIKVR